ncbi:MAG: class I SAM-dependent methyltransferase family protein [Frankia sp.]
MTGRQRDWVDWHAPYDDPSSSLARRLVLVQAGIAEAIASAPPGPVRMISVCAGQGRDLLGVLPDHPRRTDVAARLVELDPRNAQVARDQAAAAGLTGVEVVTGDAAETDAYAGAVPANLVVLAGVFGNVSEADIRRTIELLPTLCAPGAVVVWTRHRRPPDLTPAVRGWFTGAGFTELWFSGPVGDTWIGAGVVRLERDPPAFRPGVTLFRFITTAREATPRGYR